MNTKRILKIVVCLVLIITMVSMTACHADQRSPKLLASMVLERDYNAVGAIIEFKPTSDWALVEKQDGYLPDDRIVYETKCDGVPVLVAVSGRTPNLTCDKKYVCRVVKSSNMCCGLVFDVEVLEVKE